MVVQEEEQVVGKVFCRLCFLISHLKDCSVVVGGAGGGAGGWEGVLSSLFPLYPT